MKPRKLLDHLGHELWQTEVSASQHCRREAERLGDTPPARALRSAAMHADEVLLELPKHGPTKPDGFGRVGMALGKIFSEVRDTVADKTLTSERSYRVTLLGLRHGVDVVRLLRATAERDADQDVRAFCDRWLSRREGLVEAVAGQLRWFAERPKLAMSRSRGLLVKNL